MNTKTTIEVNGFAVRERRIREGKPVQLLADEVGVQRPYIAKIELGHSRRVSPAVFNALVLSLGVQDRRSILANPYEAADAINEAV